MTRPRASVRTARLSCWLPWLPWLAAGIALSCGNAAPPEAPSSSAAPSPTATPSSSDAPSPFPSAGGAAQAQSTSVTEAPDDSDDETPRGQAWTYFEPLSARVPATRRELDAVQAVSPNIAAVNGRVIWLDLAGADARRALGSVKGPVTVQLSTLRGDWLAAVERAAMKFPVEVIFRSQRDLSRGSPLGPAPRLSPLTQLEHVEGLVVDPLVERFKLPDLAGLARLKRFSAEARFFDVAELSKLPTSLEDFTCDATLIGDAPTDFGRFPGLRRLHILRSGVEDFESIKQVEELSFSALHSEELLLLRSLPKLRSLQINSDFSNRAVGYLKLLPALRELTIYGSTIDDAAMAELGKLTHLRSLRLPMRVSDAGVARLSGLTRLRTLDASETKLTARSMKTIAGLQSLRELNLNQVPAGAGVSELTKLRHLERLSLARSGVDDAGVTELARLQTLRELDLQGNPISDAALPALLQLTNLHSLDVTRTKLGDASWAALAALPNLRALWFSTDPSAQTQARLQAAPHLVFWTGSTRLNCRVRWGPRCVK
ncbi:MAG: hypothetical protein KC766_29210 [Myxococcales bacterium]|nr:hypothetical protein [Myxococcales bacterium]